MNTVMIENMIQNQGYKVRRFDTSITWRRVYIPMPHRGDEYYDSERNDDDRRKRRDLRIFLELQCQGTEETVDFEEHFSDIKKFGHCVEALGEMFEMHDDVLYKEV